MRSAARKINFAGLIMQRFFIELAYNGTPYHGWQIQPNALSVQECLDKALSVFFRQPIATVGCGRTDTGVHATQFFAHFDLPPDQKMSLAAFVLSVAEKVNSLNSLLPYEIAIKRIFDVEADAHARFGATSRAYQYHLHFRKDPFKLNRSWLQKATLDVAAMNAAAQMLMSHTDFSCFSKSNTQTFTNNCKVTEAYFEVVNGGLVFNIKADRFLRNMVRAIVGTLIRIGKKEIDLQDMAQILDSKDRGKAGQSVPACGLYLVEVVYPFVK